jgi:hypothetical protein
MNVETLKCMTINRHDESKVTLNSCSFSITQGTLCTQDGDGIKIKWNLWSKRSYVTRFLHLTSGHDSSYAISSSSSNQRWKSNQTSCTTNTVYEGTLVHSTMS